ncbi:Nn.00g012820.m01.CDS01 [Neocucurbitaria sp. VM-36]
MTQKVAEKDGWSIDINWFWRNTLIEFKNLQQLYHRYRDSITAGTPLPKKVDNALGALELILVNAALKRAKQLNAIISQRPGFRCIYESSRVTKTVSGGKNMYEGTIGVKEEFTKSEGSAFAYRTQRLWWILTQLQGPPDSEARFRYAMLLDMLNDHLANSSPTECGRLDEIIFEKLSDYATILELLGAIRMHCPRNTNRIVKECEKTEDRLFWRTSIGQGSLSSSVSSSDTSAMERALTAFQVAMPPSGSRNLDWLQKFDTLYNALQDYWSKTFDIFQARYKKYGLQKDDVEISMESLRFWKNPEYMVQLEAKREQVLADAKKPKVPESEDVFLPLPITAEVSTKFDTQSSKTKVKTRGEARPEAIALEEGAAATATV